MGQILKHFIYDCEQWYKFPNRNHHCCLARQRLYARLLYKYHWHRLQKHIHRISNILFNAEIKIAKKLGNNEEAIKLLELRSK